MADNKKIQETDEGISELFGIPGMKADSKPVYNKPKKWAIKNDDGKGFKKENGKLVTVTSYTNPNLVKNATNYSSDTSGMNVAKKNPLKTNIKPETKQDTKLDIKTETEKRKPGEYHGKPVYDQSIAEQTLAYNAKKAKEDITDATNLFRDVTDNYKNVSEPEEDLWGIKDEDLGHSKKTYSQLERIGYGNVPVSRKAPENAFHFSEAEAREMNEAFKKADSPKATEKDIEKAEKWQEKLDKMKDVYEGDENRKMLDRIKGSKVEGENKEEGDNLKIQAEKIAKEYNGDLGALRNSIYNFRVDKNLNDKEKARQEHQKEELDKLLDINFEDLSYYEKIGALENIIHDIRHDDLDLNGEVVNKLQDKINYYQAKLDKASKADKKLLEDDDNEYEKLTSNRDPKELKELNQAFNRIEESFRPFSTDSKENYKKQIETYNELVNAKGEDEKQDLRDRLFDSYSLIAMKMATKSARDNARSEDTVMDGVQGGLNGLHEFLLKAEPLREGMSLKDEMDKAIYNGVRKELKVAQASGRGDDSLASGAYTAVQKYYELLEQGMPKADILIKLGYLNGDTYNDPKTSSKEKANKLKKAQDKLEDAISIVEGKKYFPVSLDKKVGEDEDSGTVGDFIEDEENLSPKQYAERKLKPQLTDEEIKKVSDELINSLPYEHGKLLDKLTGHSTGYKMTPRAIASEIRANPKYALYNFAGERIPNDKVTTPIVEKILAGLINMLRETPRGEKAKKVYKKM